MRDIWRASMEPILAHSLMIFMSGIRSVLLILKYSFLRYAKRRQPMPDTNCAMSVATAAPKTPQPNTFTNRRSRPMLRKQDTSRNTSGVIESPSARSIAEP